jgi:hypothetical protein
MSDEVAEKMTQMRRGCFSPAVHQYDLNYCIEVTIMLWREGMNLLGRGMPRTGAVTLFMVALFLVRLV